MKDSLLTRQLATERASDAAIKAGHWLKFWRAMMRWHALQARIGCQEFGQIGITAGCLRKAMECRERARALEKGAAR